MASDAREARWLPPARDFILLQWWDLDPGEITSAGADHLEAIGQGSSNA
jgi:hypothetical protein